MAIFTVTSNAVENVDIMISTSFKAGMALMRDDNGRGVPADSQLLVFKTLEQKAGKFLGFATSDHSAYSNTIIIPDVIGSSYIDNSYNFVRTENNEVLTTKRSLNDNLNESLNKPYNPSENMVISRRGLAVYNQPNNIFITDQFARVLHGDYGLDYTTQIDFNSGDLLTFGSGVNAGKLVKVNVNSIAQEILIVGVVEKFISSTNLLHFRQVFYSHPFSNDSAVMVLDAGNPYSFPNDLSYGTVCGTSLPGSTFTITAPNNGIFDKILFASYGTPTGTCGNFGIGGCHASNTVTKLAPLLLGQNTLTMSFGQQDGLFGDPCMGVNKFLYVWARYYYKTNANLTKIEDLTTFNNDGTLINGVYYDSEGNGSLVFDGVSDYISVPITNYTLNLASVTVFCWVNLALPAKGTLFHLGPFNSGITVGVGVIDNMTLGTKVTLLYSGIVYVSSSYNFGTYLNGWNFVAISFDSSKYPTVYLNNNAGVYVSVNNFTSPYSNIVTIGKELDGTGIRYLTGKMTDIRMYSRALSASEILAYYNATKSRYGL